jgi:hypothetical protein
MEVRPSDRWAVAWEMLPYTADEEQDLIDVAFTEPGGRHGLLPQRARRWRPGPSDGRAVAPVAEGGAEVRGAEGWSRATVELRGEGASGRGQATVVRGGAPSPGTRGWRLSGGTWIGFEERENPT